jgi:hypothetical protein
MWLRNLESSGVFSLTPIRLSCFQVCEPFRARIEHIKNTFTTTDSIRIETTQKLEAEAWEYTARQFLHEYRFDTVFGADRFGTILQHLQSGNKLHDE